MAHLEAPAEEGSEEPIQSEAEDQGKGRRAELAEHGPARAEAAPASRAPTAPNARREGDARGKAA